MPYDLGRPNSRWLPYQVYRDEIIAKTVRRPYLIAGKRRGPSRWRYKRGGRWKNKARRNCLRGGNPEKKFLDLVVASAPAETGTITTLGIIPQGDGESERIGRKATITDLMFQGHVIFGTAAFGLNANTVRIDVVQDHSTNGATFSAADYCNIAGTSDEKAYRDLSHQGRFTCLWSKRVTMSASAGSGDGTTNIGAQSIRDIDVHLKCCIPIEFDASASTGAITTQQVNSLHFITWETNATPTTALHVVSRIRFVDR